jgi:hypothetical protein
MAQWGLLQNGILAVYRHKGIHGYYIGYIHVLVYYIVLQSIYILVTYRIFATGVQIVGRLSIGLLALLREICLFSYVAQVYLNRGKNMFCMVI